MDIDNSCYVTNLIKLCFFDINSSKVKDFNAGNKFVIHKIKSNYNDYYKTYTYHVRAYEKETNSNCVFTCSRKLNSKEVIFYNAEKGDTCLEWHVAFKEQCPIT